MAKLKTPKPVEKKIMAPKSQAKKAQTTKDLESTLEARRKAQSRR